MNSRNDTSASRLTSRRTPTGAMRRFLGLALAGAIALSQAPAAPALAAATDSGTITIAKNEKNGSVSYQGYKIFDATVNDDGTVSDVQWAGSDDAARTAVKNAVEGAIKAQDATYAGTTAQDAALWMNRRITGTDATTSVSAASDAKAIANAVDDLTEKVTAQPGTATTVTQGYWLFVTDPTTVSDKTDTVGTAPIFAVIGSTPVSVTEKVSLPEVDKKVVSDATSEEGVVADSQRSQAVSYVLTGTVASNIDSYDTYYYEFQDSLSKGLTYTDGSAKVYAVNDGTKVDVTSQFTINAAKQADGTTLLTLVCNDAKKLTGTTVTKDTTFRVEYTASVNGDAVIGGEGNPNTVNLVYSNNPQSDSHGKSTPKTVRDFTFKLQMRKIDDNTQRPLAGAKFTVRVTEADDAASTGKYVQADGSLGDAAYKFETDDQGAVAIKGLDAGTYTVIETDRPTTDGGTYDEINPFTVTITPTYGGEDGQTLTGLAATVTGEAVDAGLDANADGTIDQDDDAEKTATVADGTVRVTVRNKLRINLPLTGQQTMLLAAGAGVALVAVSVVALVRRRNDEGDDAQ